MASKKCFSLVALCLIYIVSMTNGQDIIPLGHTNVNEWFTKRIEPKLFNFTRVQSDQIEYRFSLRNYPDLPSWLRFMYSPEYGAGFLYGTPPERLSGHEILFDMVALNKQNYQTSTAVFSLYIVRKTIYAVNTVQMKIDNLNWVHLTDPGRVENLKNIFRHDLWLESKNDLHISFMESAIKMGGRVPLQPQQREGVIVHLSSHTAFSKRLNELQEEVKPLYKISSCTYKRTSVQTIFENAGFKLDWCAFHIVSESKKPSNLVESDGEKPLRERFEVWDAMAMNEVPQRTYIDEFAFSIAMPGVLLALLIAILSVTLCFQHEKLFDPYSELYFHNIFHICTDHYNYYYYARSATKPQDLGKTVQIVQYADNQPTTSLKSLKDVNALVDNISLASNSTNNSLYRNTTIVGNSTLRPKPPPYKPKNIHNNGAHI